MTTIDLSEHTRFGKIKDIYYGSSSDRTGLNEFVTNVVMNMDMTNDNNKNGYGIMLPDLSDIYVLISKPEFPFSTLTSSHKKSIDLSAAKTNFVLGYVWICPWTLDIEGRTTNHFIQYIDSRISGLNIAKYMIDSYEWDTYRNPSFLLPYEVATESKNYWKKHFMNVYNVKNKKDLIKMITDYGFKESDIKWENLIETFTEK
tara:strand:- start:1093 stop:1698 length:606 start_codon:yes stop_codon:yes gene_type:complete